MFAFQCGEKIVCILHRPYKLGDNDHEVQDGRVLTVSSQ